MDPRGSALCAVALLAAGCAPRELDPGGSSNRDDIAAALRAVAGPDSLMVVGVNAGAVTRTRDGSVRVFEQDANTLVEAAMAVGLSICSVEFQRLATPSTAGDPQAVAIDAAPEICAHDGLSIVASQLGGLKTAATVAVIAINTAITVHSSNYGINYFYDGEIIQLLRAARQQYVAVCVIAPDALRIDQYPEEDTPGLTIAEALMRCGR